MSGHPLPDDFTGNDPWTGAGPPAGDPLPEAVTAPGTAQPIRCPACRREHVYEPPTLPCPCGAALKVPLLRGGVPVQVRFRSWEDSWLSMRCPNCGRSDQWPQPEFTCNCGATVRLPVDRAPRAGTTGPQGSRPLGVRPQTGATGAPRYDGSLYADRPGHPGYPGYPGYPAGAPGSGGAPGSAGAPGSPVPPAAPPTVPQGGRWQNRPPFRPHPIRTAQDAVLSAARYLEWLGFGELELTEGQEREAVTMLGERVVAQVDTWPEQADMRSVECLWLQTLHAEEMAAAMFTTAGYSHQATVRGEQLLVALFTLDESGVPQPVNGAAEALLETGWTS
ncbi:hypothetical protein OG455_30620 [Kitasatospora sp. NBC_01287]|uniref:hypothetical protein n=1 Tax=Kitasatospora sp. NBC_01287 TaxID=2903573 RepID=UPI0022506386|nr:hypothetical protein [Kitasatospora sp. NBC_01287]MCX4749819.1 hypothetical protein [Kitasatospora sp. NBC_01287]